MVDAYSNLSDVRVGNFPWCLKVRVIRLWVVKSNLISGQENSIELVLLDEKGCKIHATVRRHLIPLFKAVIIEGEVYTLSAFSVVDAYGLCRPTRHPCRLFFHSTTILEKMVCRAIKMNGLSLVDIGQINSHSCDSNYLVDFMGVMTGISSQNEFLKDGQRVKMIVVEISDHRGFCHVVLFGEIVDYLVQMMTTLDGGLPVVVIQFAKIRFFRGRVLLQNIQNLTRMLFNPPVDESVLLGRRLSKMRGGPAMTVPLIGPPVKPSVVDDFLRLYPKKTIAELKSTPDDGPFIVSGVVDGLVIGEDWWYPSCRCSKRLIINTGFYYCRGCSKHVFEFVPRFRVKIHVTDGIDDAMFVLSDDDVRYLTRTKCSIQLSSSKQVLEGINPPSALMKIEGLKLLFKIVMVSSLNPIYIGAFKVSRVCLDPDIFNAFSLKGTRHTPAKVYRPVMSEVVYPSGLNEEINQHGEYLSKKRLAGSFDNTLGEEIADHHKRSRDC
ncbi:uncharacterized protein LOC123915519 isoform X1 [Trifolium pratense]|nr:uncharacterized protein LOC123915519 isoform X1 [Trifolium pratense]